MFEQLLCRSSEHGLTNFGGRAASATGAERSRGGGSDGCIGEGIGDGGGGDGGRGGVRGYVRSIIHS
ncbi:hypothetical protein GCM10011399_24450 [Subtercola lobariae]|uniref:Uncharacterized protein n=1 Tax=Subtercola lobariae TaxID=1588641 RepID=A0A917B8I2_9MICO|nr:hypothetical protein GCM10011399_24450 [Subtercola lobariae]